MKRDVMTTGGWFKYFLKMLIPFYNIYFFIICIAGNEKVNENERNYTLASLAYSFIVAGVSGILVMFLGLLGVSIALSHPSVVEDGNSRYEEISDAFTGDYQEKTTEWMITTEEGTDWVVPTEEEDDSLTTTSHTLDNIGGTYRYDDKLAFTSDTDFYISNNTDSIVSISTSDNTTEVELMIQEYSGFSASDFINTDSYLLSDSGAYYSVSSLADTVSLYDTEEDTSDYTNYTFASVFVDGVGTCYEVDIVFNNSEYDKAMEIINSIAVD